MSDSKALQLQRDIEPYLHRISDLLPDAYELTLLARHTTMASDQNADILLTRDQPQAVIHSIQRLVGATKVAGVNPGPQPLRPKVVVLSGSSRFVQVMAVCAWLLERDEGAIAMGLHLLPDWYPDCPAHHLAEQEGVAPAMDQLHLRKIDLADEVFVVNFEGYIGDSTRAEIAYAEQRGVKLRWFERDPIGDAVVNMILGAGASRAIPRPPVAEPTA